MYYISILLPEWTPIKKTGLYLLGVEKVIFVPLRVFSVKRSTVRTFVVPLRVLSPKSITVNQLYHQKVLKAIVLIANKNYESVS